MSNPPGPPHVLLKPQYLPKWEAECIDLFSGNAKRGAPAGSFGKVQSIAVHGTTAEVFFRRTAAPTTFAKIAGRWRLGLFLGYWIAHGPGAEAVSIASDDMEPVNPSEPLLGGCADRGDRLGSPFP